MSSRTVPEYSRDNMPISGLEELQSHLEELVSDSSTPFNPKLFDDVELQLNETNIPPLLPTLLPPLTEILKSTTQDPTPLISLTIKLLAPLPFPRLLTIADPPSILSALRSPLTGANLLGLAIVHKAAAAPGDAAILSTLDEIVSEVVQRWLETQDTGVAEKAGRVLGDLLEVDCEIRAPQSDGTGTTNGFEVIRYRKPPGHGRLWKLILENRSICSTIETYCSPSPDRTNNQITNSQGRLLRLLPRLATLNIHALTTTPFSDLFRQGGLLPWAALGMVDQEDILMHLNLVDFYETLVSVMRIAETRNAETDLALKGLIREAARSDEELRRALRSLPDRTVEEESESLRRYVQGLLS